MKASATRGFTLLEAIVAITIMSTASIALYSWYGTIMIGLVRTEDRMQVTEFARNLDAHLTTINPAGEHDGSYSANGFTAIWTARLVEPKQDGRNRGGQPGYYRVGLYELDIQVVEDATRIEIDRLSTRIVGYEGVRVPIVDFPGY